jgi:hypothetical protein
VISRVRSTWWRDTTTSNWSSSCTISLPPAIRHAIERHRFEPGNHRFTASLGLAEVMRHLGAQDLVDEVNARLRRASRLGGNQVISWEEDLCVVLRRRPPVRPRPSPCLVVLHGTEFGRRYELAGRTLTIGRSATNDIRIADGSVSRTHATITVDDVGVKLCDNGSRNGTHVNGVEVHESVLEYGDVIHIGQTIFALALLDPGTSDIEALNQVARVRSALGLHDPDRIVPADASTETVAVELHPSATSPEA